MKPDASKIAESIDRHRAHPEVDLRRYSRSMQLALAASLQTRRAVYLDLKFWIGMRDAASAAQTVHPYSALLTALRQAVAAGHVFCPISDSCFLEVFKQSDSVSRKKTVELIDELSLGVTLISMDLRVDTEIAHLLHAANTPDQVYDLDLLVWTKLSFVLGYFNPNVSMFDRDTGRALEKAFFDHLWTSSLAEIESHVGGAMVGRDPGRHERLAESLNKGVQEHAAVLKNFEQAYEHELVGVLDLYADRAVDILCDMTPASLGPKPSAHSADYKEIRDHCLGLMVAAMKTDRGKATMRTMHIETAIHAALRWNKGQKFKANDFFDYQHASAAVGYCDAFFTERSLANILTRSDLALDKRYSCLVASAPDAALQFVQSLPRAD